MFSFHRSSLKCQRVGEKLPHHTGKEPQAPGVHQKQEYLSAEHTAPALKDVGSGLRCAHGKGDRCGKYQHAEQYIALRRFKQQLDVIPSRNQYEYQCDQCHGTACTYAEYRQENGIEAGKVKRRQFGIEYPLIGRPSDFQYDIYDFVRKVGQQNKEYGTDGKLHGIFRFNAGGKLGTDPPAGALRKDLLRANRAPHESPGIHRKGLKSSSGCCTIMPEV